MSESSRDPRIAIIGSGFSGLCLAIRLKKAGIESFAIYEKADRLGGTWRDNTYPGCECDLPAFAYCFSFEQKTDWSHKWVDHAEILDYMEHCAEKYDLLPHIRFGAEIEAARWSEGEGTWHVRTTDGRETRVDILVSGVGQLSRPYTPDVPGLGSFEGESFHSARWNHACDLAGKDVAVVGNAASAIQFIPKIASRVRSLLVFQRSANWMLPRGNRPFSQKEKRRFRRFPLWSRLYRWWIWATFESQFPVFLRKQWLSRKVEGAAIQNVRSHISDPELQRVLVPDYPIGGKRILISDDYYPALERDNVRVVLSHIDHVTRNAVVTKDGESLPVDAIIFATGFESTAFLAPMKIEGRNARSLDDAWKDGAEAYLGISVAGFPNFFMMYGPNTNLGHNSIIFMIECQTNYIMQCISKLRRPDLQSIDVRADAMARFNERLQADLARSVWAAPNRSWYKQKDGRITNNWSSTTTRYWWKTRRPDFDKYELRT